MSAAIAGGLALALASALALDVGFLLQQHADLGRTGALAAPAARRGARARRRARWVDGFVLGLGGWGLYFAALSRAPLSLVQTVSGGGIGLLVVLAAIARPGAAEPARVVGALLATVGLLLLASTLGASDADARTARHVRARLVARRRGRARRAAACAARRGGGHGLAAGCCYGLGDVTSKALFVALPSHPGARERARLALAVRHARRARPRLRPPPARVPARRPGRVAGPMTAAMNLLPIAAGIAVFADPLPPTPSLVGARVLAFISGRRRRDPPRVVAPPPPETQAPELAPA